MQEEKGETRGSGGQGVLCVKKGKGHGFIFGGEQ